MNWNELVQKAEQYKIQLGVDSVVEEQGCNAVYVPQIKAIIVDHESVGNAQVLAHELIHAIDPECQGDVDPNDWRHYAQAEVRAEYGARALVDDPVDDGYLENYASLLDLDDVLDQYEVADALIEKLKY